MRSPKLFPLFAGCLALTQTPIPAASAAPPAPTEDAVELVVLQDHGIGSAKAAQGYLDQLVAVVAKLNAWSAAVGSYQTTRTQAEAYIEAQVPEFGLLGLGSFLALRSKYELTPLGKAILNGGGGEQYYLVSKSAATTADCKGKTLATTFGDDPRFVDRVVFAGAMSLGDFEVQAHKRPLQPLKAVARGEAVCALVDDAQLAELGHMSDATGVKPVWFSAKFPALVIVSFPAAQGAQARRFRESLPQVCSGDEGSKACASTGLIELVPIDADALKSTISAYKG